MYGQKKTRRDFQNETGLKGKNLTSHLRTLLAGGGVTSNASSSLIPLRVASA